MTTMDGWLHDKYGIRAMLLGEAILGLVFIVLFLFALQRFNMKNPRSLSFGEGLG